ncbi:twin-arginine translocase TatA/TatE family subunit [Desertihabitans brevis]|uniref:twin-arginine translocase TatA/TatE family subunit n=1 Tax=Desertihabitans brevis TaxID=2268447 RepID=UPI001313F418|nr:twin-arginine translocase TatA/TatE family subunit [Desertihabitans brevis]
MNLFSWETLVLVILGILLFGPDKLPGLARKAARVINYLRNIANNAQQQIQTELGPGFEDFDIRDPKGFIRRKIDEQLDPITADVKGEISATKATFSDTTADFASVRDELRSAGDGLRDDAPAGNGSRPPAQAPVRSGAPFDPDAT